jgi:hypothetical protein
VKASNMILVVSEQYPNGIVVSKSQYKKLRSFMSERELDTYKGVILEKWMLHMLEDIVDDLKRTPSHINFDQAEGA